SPRLPFDPQADSTTTFKPRRSVSWANKGKLKSGRRTSRNSLFMAEPLMGPPGSAHRHFVRLGQGLNILFKFPSDYFEKSSRRVRITGNFRPRPPYDPPPSGTIQRVILSRGSRNGFFNCLAVRSLNFPAACTMDRDFQMSCARKGK